MLMGTFAFATDVVEDVISEEELNLIQEADLKLYPVRIEYSCCYKVFDFEGTLEKLTAYSDFMEFFYYYE